jgi:hypothetical protein
MSEQKTLVEDDTDDATSRRSMDPEVRIIGQILRQREVPAMKCCRWCGMHGGFHKRVCTRPRPPRPKKIPQKALKADGVLVIIGTREDGSRVCLGEMVSKTKALRRARRFRKHLEGYQTIVVEDCQP